MRHERTHILCRRLSHTVACFLPPSVRKRSPGQKPLYKSGGTLRAGTVHRGKPPRPPSGDILGHAAWLRKQLPLHTASSLRGS